MSYYFDYCSIKEKAQTAGLPRALRSRERNLRYLNYYKSQLKAPLPWNCTVMVLLARLAAVMEMSLM